MLKNGSSVFINALKKLSIIFLMLVNSYHFGMKAIYSPTCLEQAAKGNTKIACLRQVLA